MVPEKKKKDVFSISELAAEFAVSTRTIRYYEERGLLTPLKRRRGTQRLYSRKDRARLKLILRGKKFGFSLTAIKEMIHLYDVDPSQKTQLKRALEYGDVKIAEIEAKIRELMLLKEDLLQLKGQFLKELNTAAGADGDQSSE